jgi:regulator of RNase E activity RraA
LTIATGDLLACDEHGVIRIPPEIPLPDLARVAAEIDRLEAEIFALCQSPGFSLEKLIALDASVAARWPGASPGKRG